MTISRSPIPDRARLAGASLIVLSAIAIAIAIAATASGCGEALPDPRVPAQHRPTAMSCQSQSAVPAPAGSTVSAGMQGPSCQTDSDCQEAGARCTAQGTSAGFCTRDACQSDGDCGASSVCQCDPQGNHCTDAADCRTDADCGEGGFCSPTRGICGNYGGVVAYRCHTAKDECIDDSDCTPTADNPYPYCAFVDEVGHWQCSFHECLG
jgi:hypothetical protein